MIARTSLALSLALLGCSNSNNNGDNNGSGSGSPDAAGTHGPDAPTSTDVTAIPLTALGGGYTAKLGIGGQAFDVIVDTGSTSAGVASKTCSTCNVSPAYDPGTAMDMHQTANSQYGSGSWKGEIFEDSFSMGTLPGVMVDFGSITSQSGFFQGPQGGFQGILGLGPDGLLLPHTTSYLTKLFGAGVKAEMAFRMCSDNSGSTMWLGGFDPSAAAATPEYTPLNAQIPYYIVNVGSAAVNAQPVTGANFGPTIIDTGTTLSFVPSAVLTSLLSSINGSQAYKTAFNNQTLADGACVQTNMSASQLDATLPPFEITFSGGTTAMSIPATQSYLFDQGGGQYCFTFSDSSQLFQGQKVSLLGNTLLGGMLTVFDIANQKIGFAVQQGCPSANKTTTHKMVDRRPTIDPSVLDHIRDATQR